LLADSLVVNQEAWPTPHHPSREPLPRVEDLPVAEQGYEQESVKAAFDSFYRHAAQLDAALQTLEAVDSFHRQAAALRADLRTLRSAGWTQQSWAATPAYGYGARGPREGISPAVWRVAGEAAFLIAVAVVLGVAKLHWWVIVAALGFAWLIVGLIEWAAARDRFAVARTEPVIPHPVVEAEPGGERPDVGEAVGWAAFEEAQEPSDAMTMIGVPPEAVAAESAARTESPVGPEPEPAPNAEAESQPEPAAVEPEPEAEPAGEQPRRRWWQRRDEPFEPEAEESLIGPPRHVRVLPANERGDTIDPWERGFDGDVPEPDADADESDTGVSAPEPTTGSEADTDERLGAVAAEGEQPRRRFRRR
jgi:hypothetical protein